MSDLRIDPAHYDALYVQAETPGLSSEDRMTYLAGIGAAWPSIRARLWELSIRVADEQEHAAACDPWVEPCQRCGKAPSRTEAKP